jgi:hypothetical protein
MNTLIALCARAEGHEVQYDQLAYHLTLFSSWDGLAGIAEWHGMGPLLYRHLSAVKATLPPDVKLALQGLYLRHRHVHNMDTQALLEVLSAYAAAGIETLILKGAALAHLVYPEPGLRPMNDIDILVRRSDARQAQAILNQLGFEAPQEHIKTPLPDKHMAITSRRVQGYAVKFEVHHNLFARGRHFPSTTFADLIDTAVPFQIGDTTAFTLGYEEMVWHQYRHAFGRPRLDQPFRLIWVADMVSLVERFVDRIDWDKMARRYPAVFNSLPLFHYLTPWSEALLCKRPFEIKRPPQGIGQTFQGWPHSSIAAQRHKGYKGILRDTFFPSEWWLRLYYGLAGTTTLRWHRWGRHPLHILGWVWRYFSDRVTAKFR